MRKRPAPFPPKALLIISLMRTYWYLRFMGRGCDCQSGRGCDLAIAARTRSFSSSESMGPACANSSSWKGCWASRACSAETISNDAQAHDVEDILCSLA